MQYGFSQRPYQPYQGRSTILRQNCLGYYYSILLLLKKVGSARLRESDIHPISPKTPAPHYQPIHRKKRNGKRVEDDSRDRADQANKKHWRALETRHSHTIEYGVSKIVPEGHLEGNKSPAVLRCSAERRCISVPMCDQSTACNPHRAPLRGCTGLHLIL